MADDLLGRLGQAVLDALPDRVAVVDQSGIVVAVNARWRAVEFDAEMSPLRIDVGDRAVDHLLAVVDGGNPLAAVLREVAVVLEEMLAGRGAEAHFEAPSPLGRDRSDRLRVVPLDGGGVLLVARDVSELAAAERRLAHQSAHDPLTGLPNRSRFLALVAAALDDAPSGAVAVAHIDLDRFGLIHSSIGPHWADRVLVAAAERLRASLDAAAVVARTGADSFSVLFPEVTDAAALISAVEGALAAVAQPMTLDNVEVTVTASGGFALSGATSGAADLLADADAAAVRARNVGRGRLAVAQHALRIESAQRHAIEQALHRAVDRGELWLEYQPEVALDTGRMVGVEALLRWQHPTLGSLPPGSFVGIAEELGMIGRIGEWVLRAACTEASSWELPGGSDVLVAVNLSGQQLADPGLPGLVSDVLAETGLPAGRLCLEVTESAVIASWEQAQSALQKLRRLGVRIAVDDFGAGYSSFSNLVRLPVDIVKIDASLVARIGWDPIDRTVVESVVALARRLGMRVVAEGVEDDTQRAVLAALGCDAVQGFGSGPPVDAETVVAVAHQLAG